MNNHDKSSPAENRMLLPFILLALAFTLLMGAMLANAVRQQASLKEQMLNVEARGQKAVEVRLHYYNLYKDLFALSSKNQEAQDIVQKYKIEFSEPEPAPEVETP